MCGIAGFLGEAVGSAQAPLATLAHRGPDDSGWVGHSSHPAHRPMHSVLLHRRLSILDLSEAGHQPMATADGAHTIVFNGEIYNYRELRAELERAGRAFRTQSDTEVLLQAYIHWGPACLRRLIGMFAFAVRDERRRLLFLARDFFGMKPLYYVRSGHPSPAGRGAGGEGAVGLPGPRWVSTIETSRFVEGRAYVCFDAHRSDDDKPYLFATEDYGVTWKNITGNLPAVGSTRVLREDVDNPDLLYCGTEFSLFASIDRGQTWTRINNNLPTVAIHEIAVHPTAGEIVAATHGRSLWILDVTALRQMKPDTLKEKAHLFKPNTAVRWILEPAHGKTNRRFVGENPPLTPQIYYSLTEPAKKVTFKVLDIEGQTLSQWNAGAKQGLNKTTWDMTRPSGAAKQDDEKKGGGKGKKGGFGQGRRFAAPGEYRVIMNVDGADFAQTLRVEGDPNAPPGRRLAEEEVPMLKNIE